MQGAINYRLSFAGRCFMTGIDHAGAEWQRNRLVGSLLIGGLILAVLGFSVPQVPIRQTFGWSAAIVLIFLIVSGVFVDGAVIEFRRQSPEEGEGERTITRTLIGGEVFTYTVPPTPPLEARIPRNREGLIRTLSALEREYARVADTAQELRDEGLDLRQDPKDPRWQEAWAHIDELTHAYFDEIRLAGEHFGAHLMWLESRLASEALQVMRGEQNAGGGR